MTQNTEKSTIPNWLDKLLEIVVRVYIFCLIGGISVTLISGTDSLGFIVLKYLGWFTLGLIGFGIVLFLLFWLVIGITHGGVWVLNKWLDRENSKK